MRPIRLQIEGLTSFRQKVEIDFSSFDLFAITGPTGAGKTSIIDAIIYALYGRTPRLGSRSVRELISQGANRLTVLLEFSCGTTRYRIARELQRKPRRTEVRLEVTEGDRWVSLGDRAGDAEPFIEQTIGLDYKGFTKAVVLPQGEFDAFLKGETDDRRKILSKLLELDVYSRMMTRANEKARDHKTESEVRERQLAKDFAEATPETLARLESELEQLKPRLEPLDLHLNRIRAAIPQALQLRQCRTEAATAVAELKRAQPQIKKAEESLLGIEALIARTQTEISELDARIQSNAYDAALHVELAATLQRSQRLAEQEREVAQRTSAVARKEKERADLTEALKKAERLFVEAKLARDAAQVEADSLRENLDAALRNHGSPDALRELININTRRIVDEQKRSKLEQSREELLARTRARAEELNGIEEQLGIAEQELAQAKSELEALQHQHSAENLKRTLEKGKPCPVCEQSVARVPKARKHPSIDTAKNSIKQGEKRVSELVKNKSTIEGELTQLTPQVEDRRHQIEDLDASIGDACSRLSKVINIAPGPEPERELVRLRDRVQKFQDDLVQRNQRLESLRQEEARSSNSAQEHQHRVQSLTVEIAGLSAEIARLKHEMAKLRLQLGEHADALAVQARLDEQERARTEREALLRSREAAATSISRSKDEQTAAVRKLEQLRGQATALEKTREEAFQKTTQLESSLASDFAELNIGAGAADVDVAAQLETRASGFQTERGRVTRDIARFEHQIEDMHARIRRAQEIREEMEKHRQEGEIARTLAHSLQSNQFIAFVQQEAFHRLAADGTRHLNTLSSERYAFASEGDDFVIIDHWNADEPRPVTTLSGGETFLASVALALALAEGLAGLSHGHARFALESLFLDEGFGTLDSETLDVVLQGVETLSTADRLVGIVSHIPELAERMPSRIHVRKSVGGSTIDVS